MVDYFDKPVNWMVLLRQSIADIRDALREAGEHHRHVPAARAAAQYLVELSATDPFASARASRRLQDFMNALDQIR